MPRWSRVGQTVTVAWSVLCWGTAAHAQGPSAAELRTLSLEELGNLVVTSVSKGEERLSRAAAAVSIITNDDIRRSGATTIAEVLRLAPGLHVARQTSNIWAVSSRGFSSQNSEKLLVQTDTRSIYTPLFAGVLWDVQDVLIEDVERIEVIRGPGAALWGSNAVNGVINITTKSARDTQGLYVSTAAGSEERFAVNARYGGRVGNRVYYRVFGKFSDHGGSFTTSTMQQDDWQLGHGGARVDWLATDADTVTMQGHVYGGDIGRLFPAISLGPTGPAPAGLLRTDVGGGNVLARWTRRSSPGSDLQVRVYYDRTRRNDPNFIDELDTFDADFQHRSAFPRRQELTWGANYRSMSNRNEGKVIFALEPASSAEQVYSGFVQHQIELADSVRLTTGTKLEHNDFSGGEIQPSGRVAWRPRAAHTVWGAVSRAVRIPTRLERDVAINVTPPMSSIWVRLLGNPEFDSERLVAVEAGYRWQYSTSLLVDLAGYHNRYRGLASLEQGAPFPGSGRIVVPIVNENLTNGHAQGFEAAISIVPVPWWRLSTTSTTTRLELTANGTDLNRGVLLEGATPRHQLGIRSQLDLGANVDVDALFRHSTAIRRLPALLEDPGLPAYAELDVRAAWRPAAAVEAAIVGQNLLHGHHLEFGPAGSRGALQRGVYASITWRR